MDLGYFMSAIFSELWRMLSLRVTFTWFGAYFSFSIFHIFIGILILSLSCVLLSKFINR